MTKETLQNIRDAIHQLNYHPNSVARGLVTRRTATIGLILSEIETPLFLQAINVIESIARGAGYNVLLCNADDLEEEIQAIDLLLEKQVDGVMFLSISEYRSDDHLVKLADSGMPLTLINRTISHNRIDQINWDNAGGVIQAMKHLFELGHRQIAHLRGPLNRRSALERLHGYQLGLAEQGLPNEIEYVRMGDYTSTPVEWQRSTQDLLALSPRPTAIIASDDIVAAVALRTAHKAGLEVPADISILGIDDQPFSIYLNPALTTVRLPITEASQRGVQLLLDRIADPGLGPRRITLPCQLIVRESTGTPRKVNNSSQPRSNRS